MNAHHEDDDADETAPASTINRLFKRTMTIPALLNSVVSPVLAARAAKLFSSLSVSVGEKLAIGCLFAVTYLNYLFKSGELDRKIDALSNAVERAKNKRVEGGETVRLACMCVRARVCACMNECTFVYVCVCACMNECTFVYVCVCVCVCVCVQASLASHPTLKSFASTT